MQVYSTNHPDKDPSVNPEIIARFSTQRVSELDADSQERYIAFLTPEEVADSRKDLQFPDYAIQECINNSVQTPKAETILEEKLLSGEKLDYPVIIFRLRQKTLHLMQYMGLMVDLSDILIENNNNVIPDEAHHMFHLIGTRLYRLERASVILRESVMQLREAYQSQVDIDANLMMRSGQSGIAKKRNTCNDRLT